MVKKGISLKKIWLIVLLAVGMIACTEQNTPTDPGTNTWYALVVGSNVFAFKTPSSNASTLVVSGATQPTLYKSVTPSGTAIFNGMGYYPATYSGGSSVSLSTYSGGNSGGGGGRPGGW